MPLNNRLYSACLYVSFAGIAVNIATVYTIENAVKIPLWVNIAVNTVYFMITPLMIALICVYILYVLCQNSSGSKCIHISVRISAAIYVIYFAAVIINFFNGWLFYFDAEMNYVRGSINRLLYWYFVAFVILLFAVYLRQKKNMNRRFVHVVRLIIPVSLLLGLIQQVSAQIMLTGTATVCALLVLFIYFQQQNGDSDHLTDLANRESFFHTVEAYASRGKRFTVLMICLRNFKQINTRYGQRTGDMLLKKIAVFLQTEIKASQKCRFSGVEFALIYEDDAIDDYLALRDKVIARFSLPWQYGEVNCNIAADFADIEFPNCADDVNELINEMEYCVRMAKIGDNNGCLSFDAVMKAKYDRRNYVINELKYVMAHKSFYLEYQPIYDIEKSFLRMQRHFCVLKTAAARPYRRESSYR